MLDTWPNIRLHLLLSAEIDKFVRFTFNLYSFHRANDVCALSDIYTIVEWRGDDEKCISRDFCGKWFERKWCVMIAIRRTSETGLVGTTSIPHEFAQSELFLLTAIFRPSTDM